MDGWPYKKDAGSQRNPGDDGRSPEDDRDSLIRQDFSAGIGACLQCSGFQRILDRNAKKQEQSQRVLAGDHGINLQDQ